MQTMRFYDASAKMQEGYRISRVKWNDSVWLRYSAETVGKKTVSHITAVSDGKEYPWEPTYEDIIADDWILVGFENREESYI